MWISRVRVTGGFLDGLDQQFVPGLNVVIGGRGAGKTTLLELVRHALGIAHAHERRGGEQRAFIEAVLGPGEVVVDLESPDGAARVVVDAQGGGRRGDLGQVALMLGQNELEAIASTSESRLNLIDLRAAVERDGVVPAAVGGLTRALAESRSRIAELREQARQRPSLTADYQVLTAQESELLASASTALSEQRESLRLLENELIQVVRDQEQAVTMAERLEQALTARDQLRSSVEGLESADLSDEVRGVIGGRGARMQTHIEAISAELSATIQDLAAFADRLHRRELDLRALAEPIRAELDESEKGLGQITTRLRNLQAQLERLDAIDAEIAELERRYAATLTERDGLLSQVELAQEVTFAARHRVAEAVSTELGGGVVITVDHLADAEAFRDALVDLLQGSGLQYRPLADAMSRTLLPRQLLELVEHQDVTGLVQAAGVTDQRAARVLEHLASPAALVRLSELSLDDHVDFQLVDGAVRKSVEALSTGQKCAVTLPILLTEHERTLILDQPEDHLDNAYLVANIVTGLNSRTTAGAQTIIATHNANIPVLGSAAEVVALHSDGTRGFVGASGPFDAPDVVLAITSLMEGGKEAFQRRATFYRTHGIPVD